MPEYIYRLGWTRHRCGRCGSQMLGYLRYLRRGKIATLVSQYPITCPKCGDPKITHIILAHQDTTLTETQLQKILGEIRKQGILVW